MDLKLEDLMFDCKVCQGTGGVRNPKLDDNRGNLVRRVVGPLTVECEACNGKGVVLTESGKVLLLFLQRAKSKMLMY
jgi:hypothetical protein